MSSNLTEPEGKPEPQAPKAAFEAEVELREICARLRACVVKHGLGLGGENVDELVINAYEQHLGHVGQFLNDMYATMIDPLEQPKMKVAEMCALLLKTAQEQRERDYQTHSASSLSFRDGWDAAIEAAKKLATASVLPEPSSDFHEGWNAATEMLKADIRALEPPTEKKGKE